MQQNPVGSPAVGVGAAVAGCGVGGGFPALAASTAACLASTTASTPASLASLATSTSSPGFVDCAFHPVSVDVIADHGRAQVSQVGADLCRRPCCSETSTK